jgi:predicted SAM-dependent methyltransferase
MRLHIGATRKQLRNPRLAPLLTNEWIHLGDPDLLEQTFSPSTGLSQLHYLPFFYKKGDRLRFDDETFVYIFSEHFFEHLFLDEACELLKECVRVLAPGGCIRVVVPDADLRTYQPIERVGFTTGDPRWFHPDKHKTRWSIYSLSYVLAEIGLRTRGVVFCDKHGKYHQNAPIDTSFYAKCPDQGFIANTDYILRYSKSLVVDAVKA